MSARIAWLTALISSPTRMHRRSVLVRPSHALQSARLVRSFNDMAAPFAVRVCLSGVGLASACRSRLAKRRGARRRGVADTARIERGTEIGDRQAVDRGQVDRRGVADRHDPVRQQQRDHDRIEVDRAIGGDR